MYRPIRLFEKPTWFESLLMIPGVRDPWPRGFLGKVKEHVRNREPIIVLWSDEGIQKGRNTQLPAPVNEDTGWFETPNQSFVAFDVNTGMLRLDIDAGDYDGTNAREAQARVQAEHAAEAARTQRAIEQLRVEERDWPQFEPRPQGWTLKDEPFATYHRLGLTWFDEDPDIVWVFGEPPMERVHACRLSTGQEDPMAVPRLADFSNRDVVTRAEGHLNDLKAIDEAARQGRVQTDDEGFGVAGAAEQGQYGSDPQMQVPLLPANGSFSKNIANRHQDTDDRVVAQPSSQRSGLSLARMRETRIQYNTSTGMPEHSASREHTQVPPQAKPTARAQSNSLPYPPAPALLSNPHIAGHARVTEKRKFDEPDELGSASSPMRPETAISNSAPISAPRSRAPQQIQRQIAQPSPNRIEQFGRPEI
ncbi:MAG: hypothetical protein Q9174_006066, partial [Haloplaca sp. 1 TL-2023]